jgi:integrase
MKFSGKVKKGDVAGTYQLLIDKLMGDKPQRVSTASTYETSKKSLQKYFGTKHNKDAILFSDLTVTTLKNYRDYLRNDGCTDATAGIYLRCLRAVYKKAIENGNARAEDYPFGKEENDKFEIPTSQGRNIALTLEEIAKIYRYDPSGIKDEGYRKNREFARDMFIFSYLVNGINIKDISRLKYRNIKDGFISFMRAKTINTSKRKRLIICQVTDDIQKIIDRWGTKPVQPDRYIFPMLYEKPVKLRKPRKLSADQLERLLVQNATGTINDHLKIIAKDCGITKPVTTYTARHSFASIGNVEGMPLSYISADLGHTSLQQTQAYLDNIETDKTREIRRRMADFTGN